MVHEQCHVLTTGGHELKLISNKAFYWAAGLVSLRILLVLALGNPWSCDRNSWSEWIMAYDSPLYTDMAHDLSDGVHDQASMVLPVYPALLATTGSAIRPAFLLTILLQQLLAGAAGIACYGIVKAVNGSDRAAIVALIAMILAPANIIWSTLILTDVPSASITAFTALLWILAVRRGDKFREYLLLMIACGLLTGLNSLIRPIGMMAVFIFTLASLLLVPLRRLKGVYALAGTACFVIMALLPPTMWRSHNRTQFGLNAVSTQQSYEPLKRLWMIDNNSYDQWVDFHTSLDSMAMGDRGMEWSVRDSIYSHRTRELFLSDPIKYIIPHLTAWPKLFSTGLQSNFLKPLYPESVPGVFYLAVLMLQALFIGGFLYAVFTPSIRKKHADLLLIAVLWFVGTVISTGPIAYSRYSLTFLWSWVSLFGISLDRLLTLINRHHEKVKVSATGER